jgi:hypothetical protein
MTARSTFCLVLAMTTLPAMTLAAASGPQVLRQLGGQLAAIRASQSPQRVVLDVTPDVKPLLGSGRQAVLAQLGVPDNCAGGSEAQCLAAPAWNYSFVHLPPGRRGGGPELMLLFNFRGAVSDAQWNYSR